MNTNALAVVAAIVAIASVPLILGRVPPNHFYGFRTPTTLANEALWYRVNHFAGWALLLAAGTSLAFIAGMRAGLVPELAPVAVVAGPLLLAVLASFVYLWKVTRGQSAATASSGGFTRRNSRHSRKS